MASKRRIRRKSCEGKKRYMDTGEARKSLYFQKRNGSLKGLINIYHCKFCGKFHLGHAPQFIARRAGYI